MMQAAIQGLAGGALIGIAATLMLLMNGRVTGISGILGGLLKSRTNDRLWRVLFLAGLFIGGAALWALDPTFLANTTHRSIAAVAAAGLLTGFGTLLGSGCTSGHGVCGISRFSPRSLAATIAFILLGMGSVAVVNGLLGGSI